MVRTAEFEISSANNGTTPHVVIVGGGFGGVAAARALKDAPVRVTLIDRTNHHLFQPLLYQVATAKLSPAQIAAPIRELLADQANVTVMLMEVTGVDVDRRRIRFTYLDLGERSLEYDYLILATGARHSYFGHDEWERCAPGLKSLVDATIIRERILSAFETAELKADPGDHPELLTFVIVGAGPTGVEMAGAIAELARTTLDAEFRRIDPARARILLLDAGSRILPTFSEELAAQAAARLERMGVEILVNTTVESIDGEGVVAGGRQIASRTVIWAAGVQASPAARWLGVEADRAGRVLVKPDCSVPGHPEVFVIGDTACFVDEHGKPLPGVAQVAMQQGRYVADVIGRRVWGLPAPPPFRYVDKGVLAVIGRGFAIMEAAGIRLAGFIAWLIWGLVHIQFLNLFNNRVQVFSQWVWNYFTGQRGSRLISGQGRQVL
ncbi:MAG: NAD(P)/FAD-dependent oxidoreductase [Gemmatimonadota bacterium]